MAAREIPMDGVKTERQKGELSVEFAQKIVSILHEVTGGNVNVMGRGGIIIASVQTERIGSVHEGAKRIMAGEISELAVTEEMAASMTGAKAGYNGAIEFEGRRVGCIGMTGDPERAKPLQKLASVIVQEELAKEALLRERRQTLNEMADEIEGISDQIRVLAINGSIQAAKLGDKGDPFKVVVAEMSSLASEITTTLKRIRLEAEKL